jgi:hypothetical protein
MFACSFGERASRLGCADEEGSNPSYMASTSPKQAGNYSVENFRFAEEVSIKNASEILVVLPYKVEQYFFAVIAQVVEHILGKDEVGSSNLPGGSNKTFRGCYWINNL